MKNVSSPYGFVPRFHVLRIPTMTGMPPDWQLEKCNIDRGHILHLDINFIYFHKLIVVPAFFFKLNIIKKKNNPDFPFFNFPFPILPISNIPIFMLSCRFL